MDLTNFYALMDSNVITDEMAVNLFFANKEDNRLSNNLNIIRLNSMFDYLTFKRPATKEIIKSKCK